MITSYQLANYINPPPPIVIVIMRMVYLSWIVNLFYMFIMLFLNEK